MIPPSSTQPPFLSQGDTGLRLSFHPTLLQKISFLNNPYHYSAVTGNTALALLLWSQQRIPIGPSIPIAEFSAAGPTNSHTPWTKLLDVSPREAALLAGEMSGGGITQCLQHIATELRTLLRCDERRLSKVIQYYLDLETITCQKQWICLAYAIMHLCCMDTDFGAALLPDSLHSTG